MVAQLQHNVEVFYKNFEKLIQVTPPDICFCKRSTYKIGSKSRLACTKCSWDWFQERKLYLECHQQKHIAIAIFPYFAQKEKPTCQYLSIIFLYYCWFGELIYASHPMCVKTKVWNICAGLIAYFHISNPWSNTGDGKREKINLVFVVLFCIIR